MPIDRPTPELSPREAELLKMAAEGYTDTAIAHNLVISEATVGTYWGRIRIKLGPYSRTELVAITMRAQQEAAVQELRREYEQLVGQLQTRGAAGGTLLYRDLLENAPDAMILVSESGAIEYANAAAHELFGYDKSMLAGQDLLCLIPDRFKAKHTEHRNDYVSYPERRQMGEHLDTPALHKSGTEFPVRASLSAIPTPSGLIVTCVVRPIP